MQFLLHSWCAHFLIASLVTTCATLTGAEVWIFAGQSNMNPKAQSKATFALLNSHGHNHKRTWHSAQRDGRPISYWASGEKGWNDITTALGGIQQGDHLAGFVFQQGESNQRHFRTYRADLEDLIDRVRHAADNPELPVYLNQLGPRYLTSAYLKKVPWWSMGFTREIQRRVAIADPHVHLTATLDLHLRDTNVHFDGQSHREIGRRIGLAAAGKPNGPIPVSAARDPEDHRTVHITCIGVEDSLVLTDGWQETASLSPKTEIPARFADWPDGSPDDILSIEELVHPVAAKITDTNTVSFTFAQPVDADALFHWGAQVGNAPLDQIHERQPAMQGLTDASNVTAAAALLLRVH